MEQERWAIILAGGEGTRLRSMTRRIMGRETPKQFCPILGSRTLLQETLLRSSQLIAPERTLISLMRAHSPFYTRILSDTPAETLIVQPRNRGTACAILYALMRLTELNPEATLAIFPSDHYISDDRAFIDHLDLAFRAAAELPYMTLLLGIRPNSAETSYGWIEPAAPLSYSSVPIFQVRRFWEKPSAELAQQLWKLGCLWNSFVVVGRAHALHSLLMSALPRTYVAFSTIRPTLNTVFERDTVERLYEDLPGANFSHEVLECSPEHLAVLPVTGVEWSDLGEPQRVLTPFPDWNGASGPTLPDEHPLRAGAVSPLFRLRPAFRA